jgi:hypothetical protein
MNESSKECWICLRNENKHDELFQPCKCPTNVHTKCLARWQIENISAHEESNCRFCNETLPDWKKAFEEHKRKEPATFRVVVDGRTHIIDVSSCDYEKFRMKIMKIYGIQNNMDFDISYACGVPGEQSRVMIKPNKNKLYEFQCAVFLASHKNDKIDNIRVRNIIPSTQPIAEPIQPVINPVEEILRPPFLHVAAQKLGRAISNFFGVFKELYNL